MIEIRVRDVDEILTTARELAFPRYSGTDSDRQAIAIVAERLEAAGLKVAIEEFTYDIRPVFRALSALLFVLALLVAAGSLLAVRRGQASPSRPW